MSNGRGFFANHNVVVVVAVAAMLVVQACLLTAAAAAAGAHPTPVALDSEFNLLSQKLQANRPFSSAHQLWRTAAPTLRQLQRTRAPGSLGDMWFQFIPVYVTSALPNSHSFGFSSPCFRDNSLSASLSPNKSSATLTLTAANPSSSDCSDFYLIATLQDVWFVEVKKEDTLTHDWPLEHASAAELDDVSVLGFRVLRFLHKPDDILVAITDTVELFVPEFDGPHVIPDLAAKNIDFIRSYAGFPFDERTIQNVTIDPASVASGDFIGVTRLDGLDPMIIWGMGGTTGHTTVALRRPDGLHVCESTVKSAYWPTPGVQCTPWQQWLEQAYNASYNFVHVPLSPANRARFNETAANEFVDATMGLPYGLHNFLFGWIDTPEANFPCLPPDFTQCLQSQAVQILAGLIDHLIPELSDEMYNQAFNFRLGGTQLKTTAEIFQYARSKNLNFTSLYILPEMDEWVYSDGPSMVCDVFVCNVLRAGGLFGAVGDKFQCAELTPRDVYSLAIFDDNVSLPLACMKADPDLPFCQLGGQYRLQLPHYNTITAYAGMANNCPGYPPYYNRPSHC